MIVKKSKISMNLKLRPTEKENNAQFFTIFSHISTIHVEICLVGVKQGAFSHETEESKPNSRHLLPGLKVLESGDPKATLQFGQRPCVFL